MIISRDCHRNQFSILAKQKKYTVWHGMEDGTDKGKRNAIRCSMRCCGGIIWCVCVCSGHEVSEWSGYIDGSRHRLRPWVYLLLWLLLLILMRTSRIRCWLNGSDTSQLGKYWLLTARHSLLMCNLCKDTAAASGWLGSRTFPPGHTNPDIFPRTFALPDNFPFPFYMV